MALSYPLDFPTINGKTIVQDLTMRLVQSAAVTQSSTSFVQQIQNFGNARWEAEITIRPLNLEEAKVFQTFLSSLRGTVGTFYFGDPQQTITSNVPVCTAYSLNGRDNLSIVNSSNHAVAAGTQFGYANGLHILLEDAPANTTTSCEITPPTRNAIPGTFSLDFTYPQAQWRLASNDIEWRIGRESLHSFTLACIEDIQT